MITPEEKDQILMKLINEPKRDWFSVDPSYCQINFVMLSALMKQFERKGLIYIKGGGPSKGSETYTIEVSLDADDFIAQGGFKFQEDIFQNSFTKLQLELDQLERKNPKINFENATKLISAIGTGIKIYKDLI